MSARILIVYGTKYGQTAKIAGRIADVLRQEGSEVTVRHGKESRPALQLEHYDMIVIGASIIGGKFQKYIEALVLGNRRMLESKRSAFFGVSGSAGGTAKEQQDAQNVIDAFQKKTGWQPALMASFAGALPFTRYNPLVRWIMKRIMQKGGRTLDTSRDYEYTDWAAVDRFAHALSLQGLQANAGAPGADLTIETSHCCE